VPSASDMAVELFDVDYLNHKGSIELPWWLVGANAYPTHGRFVFFSGDGTKKHVIVQADASSGLLYDTAVLTY
jgi:hypothetical protein